MKSREFFEKVALIRQAQKAYSATKTRTRLDECRRYEREIDKEIERVRALGHEPIEKGLFD